MEAGFGRMEASIAKNHGEIEAEKKPIVWQVRVILGGASLVCNYSESMNRPSE